VAYTVKQTGPVITTAGNAFTLPSASTAGTLLIGFFAARNTTSLAWPAGWTGLTAAGTGSADIAYYLNNPGGISSVTPTYSALVLDGALVMEFDAGSATTGSLLDQTGRNLFPANSSPVSITTSGNLTDNHELAVSVANLSNISAYKTTLGAGTNFTQAAQAGNGVKQEGHVTFDYRLDTGASSSGATQTDAVTASVATFGGGGDAWIITFKLPTVAAGLLPQQERHRVPITVPPYGRVMRHSPATYGR